MAHFHDAFQVMNWLVWKTTGEYWLLIPLGLLGAFAVMRGRREARAYLLLLLPVLWLIPLAIAAAAWDWSYAGDRTARWVSGLPLFAAIAAQAAASIYLIIALRRTRFIAGLTAAYNGLLALCAGVFVELASTGNWGV